MTENAEATLVQQVLAGRRECYRPLVEKYQKKVFLLANSMLGNRVESQDIAQEAFLLAYSKLRELKDLNKFGPWLFGIARNLCYVCLRKKKVEPESFDDLKYQERISNVVSLTPAADDGLRLQETLLSRLEHLPEKYRTLLRLKYLEDYSYEEISELLDMPVDLVRSRLFEGRRMLREQVERIRSANNER